MNSIGKESDKNTEFNKHPNDFLFYNYRSSVKPLITKNTRIDQFEAVKHKLDYLAANHYSYYEKIMLQTTQQPTVLEKTKVSLSDYLRQQEMKKKIAIPHKIILLSITYSLSTTIFGYFLSQKFAGGNWPVIAICCIGLGTIPAYSMTRYLQV